MFKDPKKLSFLFVAIILSFLVSIYFFKTIATDKTANLITPLIKSDINKTRFAPFTAGQPPTLSLDGDVATFSGEIFWQSRTATQVAKVNLPPKIHQGEDLQTGDNGNISIKFPLNLNLSLSPKSEVNFAQTLPTNLVFVQKDGTIEYSKLNPIPISIRARHLLINPSLGDLLVTIDQTTHVVTVQIKKGEAVIAFNDSQNITQEFSLKTAKEYIFDDDTRVGSVKALK